MMSVTISPIRILILEDNESDVLIIRKTLQVIREFEFRIVIQNTLAEAVAELQQNEFDVCLCDLNVPDSQGIETLRTLIELNSELPVIVITGMQESLSGELLHLGAQDFLNKGDIAPPLLKRSIAYAIDRQAMRTELTQRLRNEVSERGEDLLIRLSDYTGKSPVTARTFGIVPLSESFPEAFEEMRSIYLGMLEKAVERQIFKVDHQISTDLRDLADQLGFLKANPKDIILLHRQALEEKCRGIPRQKAALYIDEGRLLVLELMGYLVLYYRRFAFGI